VTEPEKPTEQPTWGVGPYQGDPSKDPNYEKFDSELVKEGDTRNVVDKYRYWSMEAIVADLDSKRHGFHVAIENWQHDLNIGSIVRTANAFLAKEVHIIGNKRWNRRGAMVTDRYQHVTHHPDVESFLSYIGNLPVIAIDNVPGCNKNLKSLSFQKNAFFYSAKRDRGLVKLLWIVPALFWKSLNLVPRGQ